MCSGSLSLTDSRNALSGCSLQNGGACNQATHAVCGHVQGFESEVIVQAAHERLHYSPEIVQAGSGREEARRV